VLKFGIIGSGILIFLLGKTAWSLWKDGVTHRDRDGSASITLLVAMLCVLIESVTSNRFSTPEGATLIAIAISCATWINVISKQAGHLDVR
jgi:hypothetical protein